MRWLLCVAATGIALGQSAPSAPRIASPGQTGTMDASLEAQRASVALQQSLATKQLPPQPGRAESFFSTPWTTPALPAVTAAQRGGDCDPVSADEANSLIAENATRQNLKPELLRAVIRKESAFYPCAVSPKGALGLMQLMPSTAEMLGVSDPFDPKQNIDAGARFLKQLIDKYSGDLALALSAYNAGPGRVEAAGGIPQLSETKSYVADILNAIRVE